MEIACLGIVVADVIAKPVSTLPKRGTLSLLDRVELHTGGCPVNTASALTKLGIPTGIIGKVGQDGFGDFVVSTLNKRGLDTRGLKQDPKANTSVTLVMVDESGERTFLHDIGANASLCYDDIDFNLLKKDVKILHIGGSFIMPAFDGTQTVKTLQQAKELGLTTSLDTVFDTSNRWLKLLQPYFAYLDIFLPSIEEAKHITGQDTPQAIAEQLLSYGIKTVGLKMGEQGCFIKTKDEEISLPAHKVKVVDTTGAGDAFVAGFLTGILKGWDLERTARFANATGASCVQAMGAVAGIKDFNQTLKLIKGK